MGACAGPDMFCKLPVTRRAERFRMSEDVMTWTVANDPSHMGAALGGSSDPVTAEPERSESNWHRIVLIDDEEGARSELASFLRMHGYAVECHRSSPDLRTQLSRGEADVLILDTLLEQEDGLSLIRWLGSRPGRPGIMVLSNDADETDKVLALELGADDHLAKPCSQRELLARVRALIRRRSAVPETIIAPQPDAVTSADAVTFAHWRLNLVQRTLIDDGGQEQSLSNAEFGVLVVLVENPRRTVSREDILEATSASAASDRNARAIDIQVSRLRRRLERDEEIIRTIRGRGYMFLPEVRPA